LKGTVLGGADSALNKKAFHWCDLKKKKGEYFREKQKRKGNGRERCLATDRSALDLNKRYQGTTAGAERAEQKKYRSI